MAMTLVAVVLAVAVSVSQARIGYVKSDKDASKCPGSPCEVLDYFASNYSLLADTHVLIFLQGTHILNKDIIIRDSLSMVIMASNTSSTHTSKSVFIWCRKPVAFAFINVSSLTLRSLTFQHCGCSKSSEFPSALWLENIRDLNLFEMDIQNSSGYGVAAKNIAGIISESTLSHNKGTATYIGGNMYLEYSACPAFLNKQSLAIISSTFSHGKSTYMVNNSLSAGLTVTFSAFCNNINIFLYNVIMEENYNNILNGVGGNLLIHFYNSPFSNHVYVNESIFRYGKAKFGGGIAITVYHNIAPQVLDKNLVHVANSAISHNTGITGCGLYFEVSVPFYEYYIMETIISFEKVSLLDNKAEGSEYSIGHSIGVAIFILNGWFQEQLLPIKIEFNNVSVKGSKTKHLYSASADSAAILSDRFFGELAIVNSTVANNEVSGISLVKSKVTFSGNNVISNNTGINGGGIVLCESSYMYLIPSVKMKFTGNKAATFGGAIYSRVSCSNSHLLCFYQVWGPNTLQIGPNYLVETYSETFLMENNSAGIAGHDIYAGNAANCHLYGNDLSFNITHDIFYKIFIVQYNHHGHFSAVTSDPIRVCICSSNHSDYNCREREHKVKEVIYPGKTINVSVVLVGQLDGTVPGKVLINGVSQVDINSTEKCSQLPITVLKNIKKYIVGTSYIRFSIKEYYYHLPNDSYPLVIYVKTTKTCPIGFKLKNNICTCDSENYPGIVSCNINDSTITKKYEYWIGYNEISDSKYDKGIIVQQFCPLDYCKSDADKMFVTITNISSDMQCSKYRTGLLCGACKRNYSIVVGNTECADCRSKPKLFALLVTVLLVMATIILIFLLSLFNVSVTDGTLAGPLFYANILHSNNNLFRFTNTNILKVFIAILNLDTGVGSCFYNGMDTYAKAWFQLLIPIFLWFEIVFIIIVSRTSNRVAQLVGDNGAKILATLIELSFYRALKACIISLSFTILEFPSHNEGTSSRYVWLYDANIDYLQGKHVPLFLAAGVISFFLLAYTLMLLFVQPLQRYSHFYCCSWINRLKPLIDAYTAPNIIKSRCRFWSGLLLLTRIILAINFAFNVNNRAINSLVAIVIACVVLSTVVFSAGGVYKTVILNTWNAMFIFNLTLLSIVTALFYGENHSIYLNRFKYLDSSVVTVNVSATIAFIMFIGLCLYYFKKKYFKKIMTVYNKARKYFKTQAHTDESNQLLNVSQDSVCHARIS